MRKARLLITVFSLSVLSLGCAMCDNSYDCAPPAFGGSCACDCRGPGRLGSWTSPSSPVSQYDSYDEEIVLPE